MKASVYPFGTCVCGKQAKVKAPCGLNVYCHWVSKNWSPIEQLNAHKRAIKRQKRIIRLTVAGYDASRGISFGNLAIFVNLRRIRAISLSLNSASCAILQNSLSSFAPTTNQHILRVCLMCFFAEMSRGLVPWTKLCIQHFVARSNGFNGNIPHNCNGVTFYKTIGLLKNTQDSQ